MRASKIEEAGIFSSVRTLKAPTIQLPHGLPLNTKICMDGRGLLSRLLDATIPAVLFDPQFRGVYDKLKYGN